jgi:hypothetical protein
MEVEVGQHIGGPATVPQVVRAAGQQRPADVVIPAGYAGDPRLREVSDAQLHRLIAEFQAARAGVGFSASASG